MTFNSPRIYLYKITFEEVLYYYYGVHKEKKFGEYYMGSPKTHKWCWELYTPKKQILEFFDFSDEGWIEAQKVETRLIRPVYNTDKWCLNESCGGIASLKTRSNGGKIGGKISGKEIKERCVGLFGRTKEQMTEDGKKGGKKAKELRLGVHGRTKEQMSEDGRKAGKIGGRKSGKKQKELGIGIHGLTPEQISENSKKGGKKGGKKAKELRLGVHGRTKEQMSEHSKKGGEKIKQLGIGIHGRTKEQMSEDGRKAGKIAGSQKWMCLETGYVTNAGALTNYQKNRNIDTSKRVRIE